MPDVTIRHSGPPSSRRHRCCLTEKSAVAPPLSAAERSTAQLPGWRRDADAASRANRYACQQHVVGCYAAEPLKRFFFTPADTAMKNARLRVFRLVWRLRLKGMLSAATALCLPRRRPQSAQSAGEWRVRVQRAMPAACARGVTTPPSSC